MRRLKVNPGISRYYRNSNAFQCSLEFDTEREAVRKKKEVEHKILESKLGDWLQTWFCLPWSNLWSKLKSNRFALQVVLFSLSPSDQKNKNTIIRMPNSCSWCHLWSYTPFSSWQKETAFLCVFIFCQDNCQVECV